MEALHRLRARPAIMSDTPDRVSTYRCTYGRIANASRTCQPLVRPDAQAGHAAIARRPEDERCLRRRSSSDPVRAALSVAWRLVQAGRRVLMLEKGRLSAARPFDPRRQAGVQGGRFKNKEPWVDGYNKQFIPGEYYNVGGKTKWYGAALLRFSPHEFEAGPGPPMPRLAVRLRRAGAVVRRGGATAGGQPLRQ